MPEGEETFHQESQTKQQPEVQNLAELSRLRRLIAKINKVFEAWRPPSKSFNPSRRRFLGTATVGAGVVALAAAVGPEVAAAALKKPKPPIGPDLNPESPTAETTPETIASPETESGISNQLFLDFTPMTQTRYEAALESPMQPPEFQSIEEVIARIRADWTRNNPGVEMPLDTTDEHLFEKLSHFSDHGYFMVMTANEVRKKTHPEPEEIQDPESDTEPVQPVHYDVIPLQNMLEFVAPYEPQLPPPEGVLKESGYYLRLPPEKIIAALKDRPETIINFSFQIGTFGIIRERREELVTRVNDDEFFYFDDFSAPNGETRYYVANSLDTVMFNGEIQHDLTGRNVVQYVDETGAIWMVNQITGEHLPTYSFDEMKALKAANEEENTTSEMRPYYKDKPISAYEGEYAEQNLRDLCTVAQAYPEKLFFAALGNSGEDITALKEKLIAEGVWPKNLVIVGEAELYTQENGVEAVRPMLGSAGADIFVSNSVPGNIRESLPGGSSNSTAYMSSLAEYYRAMGTTESAEILEKITTHVQPAVDESTGKEFNLFDDPGFWMRLQAYG